MSQIDPNAQWRALQENYSAMADGELESIAQEAYELTDIARQVLRAEISRRNLTIELRLSSPDEDDSSMPEEHRPPKGYPEGFDPESLGLVMLSRVEDIAQARKLKECLDAASIPSYYGPDVVDDLRLVPSPFRRTLEVKVREVDLPRARDVRNKCAPPLEENSLANLSEYSAHCPKCHSTDIVFRNLDKSKAKPDESAKFSWKCYGCGYRWKDDGIES